VKLTKLPLRMLIFPLVLSLSKDTLMVRQAHNERRTVVHSKGPWAIVLILAVLVMACASPSVPTATPVPPTPTPPPDPARLLEETAANLRDLQSTEFVVRHETGAIFIPGFSAKMTEASGSWDSVQGAELAVDAYMVPDAQTEAESGIYIQMLAVITPDAYYATDPISGAWMKQRQAMAPIPVDRLNLLVADVVEGISDPTLGGQETIDNLPTYVISGGAPATLLDWLPLFPGEGQTVRIEVWSDTERKILRKLRIAGPIGSFDQPDTVREILLTNINGDVDIQPPNDFVDLTGG